MKENLWVRCAPINWCSDRSCIGSTVSEHVAITWVNIEIPHKSIISCSCCWISNHFWPFRLWCTSYCSRLSSCSCSSKWRWIYDNRLSYPSALRCKDSIARINLNSPESCFGIASCCINSQSVCRAWPSNIVVLSSSRCCASLIIKSKGHTHALALLNDSWINYLWYRTTNCNFYWGECCCIWCLNTEAVNRTTSKSVGCWIIYAILDVVRRIEWMEVISMKVFLVNQD